jgi:hypothetical protein
MPVEGEFDQPSTPAEPTEPAEPAAERLGGGHMLMIGVALIGSGALMITVLSARGPVTTEVPARPAAATRAAPSLEASPADGVVSWIENTNQWTPRTPRRIAYEVAATKDTPIWMKSVRPQLVVRCVQGQIEAFVYTDSAAAMESADEDHAVRYWFDDGQEQTARWPDSSAHDALFAPDGAQFATQLMQARTFRFGYTPHNAAPVVAQFNVTGLGERLGKAAACKGKR